MFEIKEKWKNYQYSIDGRFTFENYIICKFWISFIFFIPTETLTRSEIYFTQICLVYKISILMITSEIIDCWKSTMIFTNEWQVHTRLYFTNQRCFSCYFWKSLLCMYPALLFGELNTSYVLQHQLFHSSDLEININYFDMITTWNNFIFKLR